MSWTSYRRDGGSSFYSNCDTYIVMLLNVPLTKSYSLVMWLLFITKTSKTSQGENVALERLKLLSRDRMVTSALVQVKTKAGRLAKLRRPVQRLYPLEVRCRNNAPERKIPSRRTNPDPAVSGARPERHPELRPWSPEKDSCNGSWPEKENMAREFELRN